MLLDLSCFSLLSTSSPSLFEDPCVPGPEGGFLWEVGSNWSRPEGSMKALNAGMALSETYLKASITNRTNLLKRRQENTLDFMITYRISLPLQKLYMLKKPENYFNCITIGLTRIPHHWAGFYKPLVYMAFLLMLPRRKLTLYRRSSGANNTVLKTAKITG